MINILNQNNGSTEFKSKTKAQQKVINEALEIINSLGLSYEGLGPRRLEKIALAFLAVLDVKHSEDWSNLKDLNYPRSMKTRDIIQYINDNFGEDISMGSYDDIRRKDLRVLVLSSVILPTSPNAATNDSRRGYALNPEYATLIKSFNTNSWEDSLTLFMKTHKPISELLTAKRDIERVPVILPGGIELMFTNGEHNVLQKEIIEEFLPRFGKGAEVLYVGDTANKLLHINKDKLERLQFFELAHDELPDVIAYSESKNWLYLIEAVHSFGPISPERMVELKRLTKNCTASIVYVTSFSNRESFRKFTAQIAWESEVWIASEPDHLIHFNGDKFMGPHI